MRCGLRDGVRRMTLEELVRELLDHDRTHLLELEELDDEERTTDMKNDPPVIFIHGFIGTLDAWQYEPKHASPDLLGYGKHRSVPFEQISLLAQVEHIRGFVDARFGARRVDVVGHSIGGSIAMLFAHAYPGYVRRIVNVEGNFTLDAPRRPTHSHAGPPGPQAAYQPSDLLRRRLSGVTGSSSASTSVRRPTSRISSAKAGSAPTIARDSTSAPTI